MESSEYQDFQLNSRINLSISSSFILFCCRKMRAVFVLTWGLGFATGPSEESTDYCETLHPLSTGCDQSGLCYDLFWVDSSHRQYVHDTLGRFHLFLDPVTCIEARTIFKNSSGSEVTLYAFDMAEYAEALASKMTFLEQVISSLQRFPFDDTVDAASPAVDLMGHLFTDIATKANVGYLEKLTSNIYMRGCEMFGKFWATVRDMSLTVSLLPLSLVNQVTRSRFANYAFLALDIDGSVFQQIFPFVAMNEELWFFSPSYKVGHRTQRMSYLTPAEPLIESQAMRAASFAFTIDNIVGEAARYRQMRLTGQPLAFGDAGVAVFGEIVKVLIESANSGEDVSEPTLLVLYLFQSRICPNIATVAEYLVGMSLVEPGDVKNQLIGSMVELCISHSSAQSRIATSVMFTGMSATREAHTGYQTVLHLPRGAYINASHLYLLNPAPVSFLDLIVVSEGAETVGYVGQRKQWIGQMIESFFSVDPSNNGLWVYTDESKRFITLNRNYHLGTSGRRTIRAAGRVMGFAIRYDIPMGKSFAPSFIRALRLLNDPEVCEATLDEFINDEDPAFMKGVTWLRTVNWAKPPEAVKWFNLDGLVPDGETVELNADNLETYILGKKREKFFYSLSPLISIFRAGVADTVGAGIFGMLTEEELRVRLVPSPLGLTTELLVNGLEFPRIQHDQHREWFLEIVSGFNEEERRTFHFFVTGVREPPITAETEPWIRAFFEATLNTDSLPVTHTCHNEIQIPVYPSIEVMREKLVLGMTEANTIEGYPGYGGEDPPQTAEQNNI